MSWQFQNPLIKIINNSTHEFALCTSTSDFSASSSLGVVKNNTTLFLPLSSSSSALYTDKYRIVKNNTTYYPRLNTDKIVITYTRTSTNPTLGITAYTWTIVKIVFEMPLPSATSGSLVISANTSSKSGTLATFTAMNQSSYTVNLQSTYGGTTVSGSCDLSGTGSVDLYLKK